MLPQESFIRATRRILGVAALLTLSNPAFAAPQAAPDPILSGPAPGPCAEQAAGADYVAGVDAAGNPVVPAEGPAGQTMPDHGRVLVAIPRPQGREVSVPVDLAALSPPSCMPPPPRR